MRGQTKKVSLCGIFAALAISIMFLGTIFEAFDLSSVAFASFTVYVILQIYGCKWGICQYLLIALLSSLFFFGKFVFLVFITIGYYPIVKYIIERNFKNRFLKLSLKLFLFNIGVTLLLFFGKKFLFELDSNGNISLFDFLISYPFANIFILLYDLVCDKIIIKYKNVIFLLLK